MYNTAHGHICVTASHEVGTAVGGMLDLTVGGEEGTDVRVARWG